MAFFDPTGSDTIVLSPSSQFMVASHAIVKGDSSNELHYGLLGSVTSVPVGWSLRYILSYGGGTGINNAIHQWGRYRIAPVQCANWCIQIFSSSFSFSVSVFLLSACLSFFPLFFSSFLGLYTFFVEPSLPPFPVSPPSPPSTSTVSVLPSR